MMLTFSAKDVTPTETAVFENQGIPRGARVRPEIRGLYANAMELFRETATPAGLYSEISQVDFGLVYKGEGGNDPDTPVAQIYPRANHLALYAVTLGLRISERIARLFNANDPALGCMLDSVASVAADRLAERAGERYRQSLADNGESAPTRVLGYSPGYCGWHISGQRKLFDSLHPERINLSLRDTYLMDPLKSVSGVLIAGSAEVHSFEDSYPFCAQCATRACRERIGELFVK